MVMIDRNFLLFMNNGILYCFDVSSRGGHMTREELLEDVKVGDYVKIYTEAKEVFIGSIIDFGPSGLKINLVGSPKVKRIMYDKITEYDIEDELEKEINFSGKNIAAPANKFSVDLNAIFKESDINPSLEEIYHIYESKLSSEEMKEYTKVKNSLDYAKKIKEYDLNNDRVKKAIVAYKNLAVNNSLFNIFIGRIYQDLEAVEEGIEYHRLGRAYDILFFLGVQYKDKIDLFEAAILAINCNCFNKMIVKWLCEYAVAKNDASVISYLISKDKVEISEVLLSWFANKEVIADIPNKENLTAVENIEFLKDKFNTEKRSFENIEKIIKSEKLPILQKNPVIQEDVKEEVFRGTVFYYNKQKGIGTIKNLDGKPIFFHISQVIDDELQRILGTEQSFQRRVVYSCGINFAGKVAADVIRLDQDYYNQAAVYTHEGIIEDYDVVYRTGKIISNNNTFKFRFDYIKDPFVYAEIMANPNSIRNLEVKFNTKGQKSKQNNRFYQVAIDVIGLKEYNQEEIETFISQRYITRDEVNEWLGIDKRNKNVFYRKATYKPLAPLNQSAKDADKKDTSAGITPSNILKGNNKKQREQMAIEMVIPQDAINPFINLENVDDKRKRYYQEAHSYMVGRKNASGDIVGVDLKKAEELFIKAICASEQVEQAVANLINIYLQLGGEYIIKGLQLLDTYGYLFTSEKLTVHRLRLIEKSGNSDAYEQLLLAAIENCSKNTTLCHYMNQLGTIYYKQEKWIQAKEWFGKCIQLLDEKRFEFGQYSKLRNNNLKSLIITSFYGGFKDQAVSQAKSYLKDVGEDAIISSIVDGTIQSNESIIALGEKLMEELYYDINELADDDNDELDAFILWKLKDVDLTGSFNKVIAVYEKLEDGVFKGNSSDARKAVKVITDKLKKNKKFAISSEFRSANLIGIAKIFDDARRNIDLSNEDRIPTSLVKSYFGKFARYNADVMVEKYMNVDSVRFMYIQALKHLVNNDTGNIYSAMNMLMASFFIDSKKLPEELHDIKYNRLNDDYFKMNCVSIKDFLISTFMLSERKDYVTNILSKAYANDFLREELILGLSKMEVPDKVIREYYDFNMCWEKSKKLYYSNITNLEKEIAESVNEYHMSGTLRQHISRIEEILSNKMLWNKDEAIIEAFVNLLRQIASTFDKYTVEEKIEGFRVIEAEIIKLKSEIESSPTDLSFTCVYRVLDLLKDSIRERFDDLYNSSEPECEVFLSNESVYVDESSVEIVITFKNADNKQDADAVLIKLEGSEGSTFIKCEKNFTNIRSGEQQDYIAVFNLDDSVIAEGQFEVLVNVQYEYKDAVESIKTYSFSTVLPVNIKDKDNYEKIENKYNRIIRGSSVDIPELFKGRNDLIDSICSSMSTDGVMIKNRGVILWGQRRVGKNSVKDYLKEKIRTQYPGAYIFIELGSIGKCRNLREVLITIINNTEDTLMQDYYEIFEQLESLGMQYNGYELEKTDSYMPAFNRFMDRLSRNLNKISGVEKNIPLYFIDEFSYLYEWIEKGEMNGKEFMRFWKSFIQDYGICAIIIGQDNIPVWKSMYENEFACMNHDNEITYLDFNGAKELICEPCQKEGKILFAPDAIRLIYDWTKGSAYLIVIFCKHIIDYLNDNFMEKATKTIVQIVFEKEFLDKKEMFMSEDFEPQIEDVANVGKEGEKINKLNEILLKEIAKSTVTASNVQIADLSFFDKYPKNISQKVFERLRDRKIIDVERGMYCSINMPLLKFYLLREQSLLTKDILNAIVR